MADETNLNQKTLAELSRKLDAVIDALPVIYALGSVLVRLNDANDALGLGKNTISNNPQITKYEPIGERKTFVSVGDLRVVKKRKRKTK